MEEACQHFQGWTATPRLGRQLRSQAWKPIRCAATKAKLKQPVTIAIEEMNGSAVLPNLPDRTVADRQSREHLTLRRSPMHHEPQHMRAAVRVPEWQSFRCVPVRVLRETATPSGEKAPSRPG